MAVDAGFAAVVVLGQEQLQDMVRVFHVTNTLPHALKTSFKAPAASVAVDLFVDAPALVLSAANAGKIELDLDAWGPVTITLTGKPSEARLARLKLRLRMDAIVNIVTGGTTAAPTHSLQFGLDGGTLEVDHITLEALAGGPFSSAVDAFVASDEFHAALYLGMLGQLGAFAKAFPPLSFKKSILDGVLALPGAFATAVALDGALAIGIDAVLDGATSTSGNASALTDFRGAADAGLVLAPAAVTPALTFIRDPIAKQVDAAGATLEDFAVTVQEGSLHIAGSASKSGGTEHFSFDAIPRLIRPGTHEEGDDEYGEHWVIDTPPRHELWMEIANIDVDIDRPWWSAFIEAAFPIVTIPIVEGLVGMVVDDTAISIGDSSAKPAAPITMTMPLGTTGRSITIGIVELACHADDLVVRLSMSVATRKAGFATSAPMVIYAEQLPAATYDYKILLPDTAHPLDPQLRLRWIARRDSVSISAIDEAATAAVAVPFTLDLRTAPMNNGRLYTIECRVYRTLGPATVELGTVHATLEVYDRLDRSHPFVRWQHDVITPNVQIHTDHTHELVGYQYRHRKSAIHRTTVPGRCLMVSRYSKKVGASGVPDAPQLEYLDALPFPVEDLVPWRDLVCDYCFFGGPDKKTPKTL